MMTHDEFSTNKPRKNAGSRRTRTQRYGISEGVVVTMESEIHEGRKCDTRVWLGGDGFTISGDDCESFRRDLAAIIEKYRI